MSKLFIIGNGFDLDHKVKSSYEDFHQFLNENYTTEEDEAYLIPEMFTLPDGGEGFDETSTVMFLKLIISNAEKNGAKWSDVETALGRLEYGDFLDDWGLFDEDDNEWHKVYRNEDNANSIRGATLMIQELFSEWINQIEISHVTKKVDFEQLLSKNDDVFLTFNYTLTLEVTYDIKNICHLHGKINDYIHFGHGYKADLIDYYQSEYIGSEYILHELHEALRKKTELVIQNNEPFFSNVDNRITEIYSYGFSFSEVDLVYISEIISKLDTTNITWYFNDYDFENTVPKFKKTLIDLGFKGSFNTFHINL